MNVLVIAPHPDDETLGCGGTLLKLRKAGHSINWLIMTKMTAGCGYTRAQIAKREKEIAGVARLYSFDRTVRLGFPAARLDSCDRSVIVKKLSLAVRDIRPELILVPNAGDIHSDHRITFESAAGCTKSFRYPFVRQVLAYETLSETESAAGVTGNPFVPNAFSDITAHFDEKLKIMSVYSSEYHPHPFPRGEVAIKALAALRGSTMGAGYAESFMVLREYF